jgi:nickel-dependent lactate racemase
LGGNPVYEDSVEHARAVGHDFIVNVILDKDKRVGKVFAGDWMKAYIKGVEAANEVFRAKFRQKMDITITTNYGYPLDSDLYQTVKGITTASCITKKGGCIIAVSKCERGAGPEEFWKLHKEAGSPNKVLAAIKNKEFVGVQWQNQMLARVQLNQEIYLVSELQDSMVEDFMIEPADSVEAALAESMEKFGENARIAILPEGPATLPVIEE